MYDSLVAANIFFALLLGVLAFAIFRVFDITSRQQAEFRTNQFNAALTAAKNPRPVMAGVGAPNARRTPLAELSGVVVESSSPEIVPGLRAARGNDGSRLADAAAVVVRAAVKALGTSHEGRSLEPFATPTTAEELACVVKAVRAYALATTPQTAYGPLQVEVLAARALPRNQGEARVVICTPPTADSGHREAVVRADQIWRLGKQPPTSCGACGAPVVDDTPCCEYCNADIGEGAWRIVEITPTRDSASPLSGEWAPLENYRRQVSKPASTDPLLGTLAAGLPDQGLV